MQLSEQEILRREKLKKLRQLNIDPYPCELFPVDSYSNEIKTSYKEGKKVVIAGRMMRKKIQGKAAFAEIQDSKGRIQVYFNRDNLSQGDDTTHYNIIFKKLIDLGDFIGIEGTLFKTKVGEISVMVNDFKLLSKSLRSLPLPKVDAEGNIHDEFTDVELRYRQRYTDLIVNPYVKDIFIKRTKLFDAMRSFFNQFGYLEVETPILQPIPGGAAARPFVTHHNSLNIPLYMRIANELYLKRLIVGGFDGVYEFAKNFRNEGMDRTHNPEFTGMEIYVAYKDYKWMMEFTEQLLEHCAMAVNGTTNVIFGKDEINFKPPFKKVTIRDAIHRFCNIDILSKSEEELRVFAKKIDIDADESIGKGKLIDEIFSKKCSAHYIQPTFIIDYPKEMSPLSKKHRENPELTERFELLICGKEIANAYTELNDPIDQKERFENQLKLSKKGDEEALRFIDYDFLKSLEYGMPPTAGLGIGMDRLVMFLTNSLSIQEVLFFPQMRPEKQQISTATSENEKTILDVLKGENTIELAVLKETVHLSSKNWDKAIKELRKKEWIKIEIDGDLKKVILQKKM